MNDSCVSFIRTEARLKRPVSHSHGPWGLDKLRTPVSYLHRRCYGYTVLHSHGRWFGSMYVRLLCFIHTETLWAGVGGDFMDMVIGRTFFAGGMYGNDSIDGTRTTTRVEERESEVGLTRAVDLPTPRTQS
ncbi:unnamed protein product, partial [Ectocarpus sp. 12 AP-2014]